MNISTFENKNIATYIQKGEGTPLLFIHGFCGESSIWDQLITRFPGRYILRIDLPGFGHSEQIENYSIARYAQVVQVTLKKLEIDTCIFIGHSMGGYVGLEFAHQFGTMLKGLCLFHSHPYPDTEEKQANRKKSIEFIQKNGPIYYVKQLIPALFASNYSSNNHLELAKLVFTASKYTADNIIAGLEVMMSRTDHTGTLNKVPFPCLFIIGQEDTVVPSYLNDAAATNISSIHVLKGIGHMGMLEATRKCERAIKDFTELVETWN